MQPVSGNQARVVGDQKCNDRGDIFRTGDVDEIRAFCHMATHILGDPSGIGDRRVHNIRGEFLRRSAGTGWPHRGLAGIAARFRSPW
jgi:hypothetical protein